MLAVLCLAAPSLTAGDFQAGLARVRITPPMPFWLSGYAARTNPAARVESELWAKALALQDEDGGRLVLVTTDLIGLPRQVSDEAARRLRQKHGLDRARIVFNSSHTHCGPAVWPNLRVLFDFKPEEEGRVAGYSHQLALDLAGVASEALSRLAPARVSCAWGAATFAINRRQPAGAAVRLGENPADPVDHRVPVLKVATPDGALRAVLFGYACHNTTLGGDFYQVDGDYAGCAQRELEREHPGSTALFVMLCGGDQNPHPRGTYRNVEDHGKALAQAVEQVLGGPLHSVRPPIRAAWQTISLEFASHTRETFEREAEGNHVFARRRARLMLEAYERGQPIRRLPYPVQAVRLSDDFSLLALGGEVVVDYALRARREFPAENLVVAGYCNDVSCYIPSLRVLREGGYEPVDSMIYYAQPGPLSESVEDDVFKAIRAVMHQAGAR